MGKKTIYRRLMAMVAVMAVVFTTAFGVSVQAAETQTYTVTGKFHQTDARSMLKKVNKFRTGKEAWYYDEQGSKLKFDSLKKYTYDYELEKIAMQRAMEISVLFSHTRPNGESCFSLYPQSTYNMIGENIAMGTGSYLTVDAAFEMWQENDYGYEGQGHRRNMLSDGFSCIGIACFEINGDKYWVQEFGNPNSGAKKTKACNKTKTKKIKYVKQ
ncbi:MAG: CAP domain-containing protein [Lachnospiraceae bacterium]|nr:CAP domain-containing protein [Lachnospiraceae bacterium]